jgi:hypothetical protein
VLFLHKYDYSIFATPPGFKGLAYVPKSPSDFYDYQICYYGYAMCEIESAIKGYTAVHEIGHTLGCHHHYAQNADNDGADPGPGWFPYSSGFKAMNEESDEYCTVMAYEKEGFYSDNPQYHYAAKEIPYFSMPASLHSPYKVPIGDAYLADNTLTIKKQNILSPVIRTCLMQQ